MDDQHRVSGISRSESALLRAMVDAGASSNLLEGVEPGAADDLADRLGALESPAGDGEPGTVDSPSSKLERQREGNGLEARGTWARAVRTWRSGEEFDWVPSPEMRRALRGLLEMWAEEHRLQLDEGLVAEESRHFDVMLSVGPERFRGAVTEFGLYQMAELVRGQNRRRIARLLRELSESSREVLVAALERDRSMPEREHLRLQEVFVTLSRHYETLYERVLQLGLYSIACAAGYRFGARIEERCRDLPEELADRLRHYWRLSYGRAGRSVGRHLRASFESFLDWRGDEFV